MKITVDIEIVSDGTTCREGDSGGWYTQCQYRKTVTKRMKDKKGVAFWRDEPRCIFFKEWLDGFQRCGKCIEAQKRAESEATPCTKD